MKKQYWCLIKSHSEANDFDCEFEANNDADALEYLTKYLHNSFDKRFLAENTVEVLDGKNRRISSGKFWLE